MSFSILIQHIETISLEDLDQLSNSQLIQLFSSPDLTIENEDFLFQTVLNLIEKNSN
jgi:hypothetical protein